MTDADVWLLIGCIGALVGVVVTTLAMCDVVEDMGEAIRHAIRGDNDD